MSGSEHLPAHECRPWVEALQGSRWYQHKSATIEGIEILDQLRLEGCPPLVFLRLFFVDQDAVVYAVPEPETPKLETSDRSGAVSGEAEAILGQALFDLIRNGKRVTGQKLALEGRVAPGPRVPAAPAERLQKEMSSVGYRFGTSLLKWQRRLCIGESLEVTTLQALALEGSFRSIPRVLGELVVESSEGWSASLAVLVSWIPNDGDLFSLVVRRDFQEHTTELAHARFFGLGQESRRLHVALSQVPLADFVPRAWSAQSTARYFAGLELKAANVFETSLFANESGLAAQQGLARRLWDRKGDFAALARKYEALPPPAFCQRVHGDYHLGQILSTPAGLAVLDFEGDPLLPPAERHRLRSPLTDVASLLRSIDYAASVASHASQTTATLTSEALQERTRELASSFWQGYGSGAGLGEEGENEGESRSALLQAHLFKKALEELSYELNVRPAWAHIPLRGLLNLLESADE
jgi:maltose alpha-D-glucosyltransferase / alpha-amylase